MTLDAQEARELLHAERDKAEHRLRATQVMLAEDLSSSEVDLTTEHPGDNASYLADREVAQTSAEQAETDLREVDDALARLEQGTYGYCAVDGEPIDPERLRARPMARYCTTHQQEIEAQT